MVGVRTSGHLLQSGLKEAQYGIDIASESRNLERKFTPLL